MAKRFTDSNKYKKLFYRGLPGPYKLLWDFLYHDCDNCGIWIVDFEMAQNYVGKDMPINKKMALELFNEGEVRIIEIKGGEKWFLPGFIEFQYVQLSEKNRAHIPVIAALKKLDLLNPDFSIKENLKGDLRPLQGAKDKAQEKEKDKDMEKEAPPHLETHYIVVSMEKTFRDHNAAYPFDTESDFPCLFEIGKKLHKWLQLGGQVTDVSNLKPVLFRWGELVVHIKADPHLCKYSLTQINKHFQSVVQSFNNAGSGKYSKNNGHQPVITGAAEGAGTL